MPKPRFTQESSATSEQSNLERELQQIKGDLDKMGKGGSSSVDEYRRSQAAYTNLHNKGIQLQSRLGQMQQQKQQQGGLDQSNKAKADAEAARDKMMGLAQGGVDRLNNDPTDNMFRDYLKKQMGGDVLDANGKPFADGAPKYNAEGMAAQKGEASSYDAAQMSGAKTNAQSYDASGYDSANMNGSTVNYKDPFDQQTIGAMVNEQAAGAGAAESSRNQMMRDAVLANGGNAFDPSLQAAQAESMGERNKAVANARNQINMVANRENAASQNAASMANAGFAQQAGQFNAANANQARQFNAGSQNQAGQFNASARQSADSQNAGFQQQANQINAGAQNQAGQFNAGARQNASFQNAGMAQQAGQFNAGAQNQAGMFNAGNQMTAQSANFQAGQNAQMYNQGQRSQAAGQMGSYNNQRQGMISDAEGRQIGLLGQQVFRGPETGLPGAQQPQQMPNFQQWSSAQQPQQQAQPQQQQRQPERLTGSVWAGSGRPSVGSGFTTSSFGPTKVGNPWGAGAQVGTNQPAVGQQVQRPAMVTKNLLAQAPLPGVKTQTPYPSRGL